MRIPWYRITKQQLRALYLLYQRSPDGAKSFLEFRNRIVSSGDYYMLVPWCGMFVGIERDGYIHS